MLNRRKPMSIHKTLLPLLSALVLGVMAAGQANAGTLVWSAKFACGVVPFDAPGGVGTSPPETDFSVGRYLTSINIHNPQKSAEVQFLRKIVRAREEGLPPPPFVQKRETLAANEAMFVDCPVIYRELADQGPGTLPIEGFIVIEVEETPTGEFLSLDVVGKYTARSPAIGIYSPALEIVVYYPTVITN
jgi:hypothetical protein